MELRNRLLIAGTGSGAGKTTAAVGLMGALKRRGYTVQGYKCGPDYIDPTYHTLITGRPSRNLDAWMLPRDTLAEVFLRSSQDAHISVMEGVMGLFDGKDPLSDEGSSAEIASILEVPVLLVVDVSGTGRSAAAVVKGFQAFKPGLRIAGVIANRCGSERHFQLVRSAVEQECGIPAVCWIGEDPELRVPERHLGLVPADEFGAGPTWMDRAADAVERGMDWETLLRLAEAAPPITYPERRVFVEAPGLREEGENARPVIAYARDQAFLFYYPENLELLELNGALLKPFSPLAGERVPADADGVYMGGGYPEMFGAVLASHSEAREDLRVRILEQGLPVYAECGGYMYLSRMLEDKQGLRFGMVGAIPGETVMRNRLAGFGYREAVSHALLPPGERARGHEFHYSEMKLDEGAEAGSGDTGSAAYRLLTSGGLEVPDGYRGDGVVAGYAHFHFASNPKLARGFVDQCRQYRRTKQGGGETE